ncbi:MAG: hypothetical protein GXO55_03410 [Chloroflexi bacterium]|nr:hypothetical protein [Chloroflexota bacterium]
MSAISRQTFWHAVALVLGFTLIFTILGASVGFIGYALYDVTPLLVRVGGIMLVVFGLRVALLRLKPLGWVLLALIVAGLTYWLDGTQLSHLRYVDAAMFGLATLAGGPWTLGVHILLALAVAVLDWFSSITPPALRVLEMGLIALIVLYGSRTEIFEKEFRLQLDPTRGRNYWTSFLVGIVFAAGWTPCVGPILAGILLLASTRASAVQGALLLAVYSAGLGIPFLLTGALFSWAAGFLPRLKRHLGWISLISGMLLLFIGILIFTDSLRSLAEMGFIINVEGQLAENTSGGNISFVFAFLAGLASFLSPCVLPLVPAYLSYLSGAAVGSVVEGDVVSLSGGHS